MSTKYNDNIITHVREYNVCVGAYMNIVFSLLMLISMILLIISNPDEIISAMISGANNGIKLMLSLIAIYGIWMSILDITDKIGVSKRLGTLMRPLTKRLFKGEDDKTLSLIANNFSLNMLGMGGAATPLGIQAIERMQGTSTRATDNSILFTVINATSIQLLPMTIIGMRSTASSSSPSDIILPTLISTTIATTVGVILSKVFHD